MSFDVFDPDPDPDFDFDPDFDPDFDFEVANGSSRSCAADAGTLNPRT